MGCPVKGQSILFSKLKIIDFLNLFFPFYLLKYNEGILRKFSVVENVKESYFSSFLEKDVVLKNQAFFYENVTDLLVICTFTS